MDEKQLRLDMERYLREWDEMPDDGEEYAEGAVLYALRRDREETRHRLDKWIENAIDKRQHDTLEAGLVRLKERYGGDFYLSWIDKMGWQVVCPDDIGGADTPTEAVDAALKEINT